MSGFLHQFATRSLGLAPQIKPRAALPYAAPTVEFSPVEAASPVSTPTIERPEFAPSHTARHPEQATDNALPAPVVACNREPSTPVEQQTATPSASQPSRISALPLPDNAPHETSHNSLALPPAIVTSPVAAKPKSVGRQLAPAPETRPAENAQPAFPDLESLVSRLLGDTPSQREKSPESAAPTIITARQTTQRPAEISTIRPQPGAQRQSPAPEADSPPEVHITIGRLEVNPPSRPAPASQPQQPRGPAPLSLSDYLARRHGGRS